MLSGIMYFSNNIITHFTTDNLNGVNIRNIIRSYRPRSVWCRSRTRNWLTIFEPLKRPRTVNLNKESCRFPAKDNRVYWLPFESSKITINCGCGSKKFNFSYLHTTPAGALCINNCPTITSVCLFIFKIELLGSKSLLYCRNFIDLHNLSPISTIIPTRHRIVSSLN